MATTPLIPAQIEPLFQAVTALAVGATLPNGGPDPDQVRLEWQTESQPEAPLSKTVTYLRCVEEDDQYNRVRDSLTGAASQGNAPQVNTYIRVWRVYWCFYGPGSFDNARKMRSALLMDQGTHDALMTANLALVTDMRAPLRVPERWSGGQWRERVDFEAAFNELVTEVPIVPVVNGLEVIIEVADHSQA